ncbi:MAG: hypothetical protein AMXMBFR47_10570 [Planctomycetota bacterium]
MQRRGGRLLAVSVDSPERSRQVVERFRLPFPILADEERDVIRAYGLVHAGGAPDGGDIAIPTLMLLGTDGRVLWRRVAPNVMDRLDPAEALAAVRSSLAPR